MPEVQENTVTYEELAALENEFDEVETEIIRKQTALAAPLYERRKALIAKLPNFWGLVLEQAPLEIDQFIHPSDSPLLIGALLSLEVSHFEIPPAVAVGATTGCNDPRSVSIKFEFAENEWMTNKTLEKKFWYRHSKNGWAGLVSEPVTIDWKKGMDITGGLLNLACQAYKTAGPRDPTGKKCRTLTADEERLKDEIERRGLGGVGFFAWFGFIGRRISEEESQAALQAIAELKTNNLPLKADDSVEVSGDENWDDQQDIDLDEMLEIFPEGDDVAVALAEDVWPGAIKYFTRAQEQDEPLSELGFESDEDEEAALAEILAADDYTSEDEEQPKKKKMRSQ